MRIVVFEGVYACVVWGKGEGGIALLRRGIIWYRNGK